MITPIISGVSSALQTLDQLLGLQAPSSGAAGPGAFSTGQTLPAGAPSPAAGAGASTPSSQFAPATLGFLTSLQDAGSQILSTTRGALGSDLTDIGAIVSQLQKALNGSQASTTSAQATSLSSTSTVGASPLSASTTSALVQSLNQLATALQSLEGHHHHHHGGGAPASSGASPDSINGASASDAGASASTPGAAPSA